MDVYEAIYKRRDIRQFRSDPIPEPILRKVLEAAHHAGSVGFMQPWNFLVIRSPSVKQKVYDNFSEENDRAAQNYDSSRRELYKSLKLEGILESPINIAITCDSERGGPTVLGRNTVPEMDVYSTCGAIQNLWLAGRAEGVGVGWVSIIDHAKVKEILGIPEGVKLVAYLCLGYPKEFRDKPLLEEVGWRERLKLEDLVFAEHWGQPSDLFKS